MAIWHIALPRLTISWLCYLLLVLVLSLGVRIINTLFRAWGLLDCEHLSNRKEVNIYIGPHAFLAAYRDAFLGFKKDPRINDYWLPAFIGTTELLVFPFLLHPQRLYVIGAWIGIKVASSWGVWARRRSALNRFLLANILVLGFSYFLSGFVQ